MAEHPNVARLKNLHAAFARGDLAALNDVFADQYAGAAQSCSVACGRVIEPWRAAGHAACTWRTQAIRAAVVFW